jgi:hypothetical protein
LAEARERWASVKASADQTVAGMRVAMVAKREPLATRAAAALESALADARGQAAEWKERAGTAEDDARQCRAQLAARAEVLARTEAKAMAAEDALRIAQLALTGATNLLAEQRRAREKCDASLLTLSDEVQQSRSVIGRLTGAVPASLTVAIAERDRLLVENETLRQKAYSEENLHRVCEERIAARTVVAESIDREGIRRMARIAALEETAGRLRTALAKRTATLRALRDTYISGQPPAEQERLRRERAEAEKQEAAEVPPPPSAT